MNDVEANLDANRTTWGAAWDDDGEKWSKDFGGTQNLWSDIVFPHVEEVLPAENILEIAVGYGRITEYLNYHCDQLYGIDLNENCVRETQERLPNAIIKQNDGLTIPFDVGFDLVISWDSLVHCHPDIVKSYITEASRKLNDYGIIFLHHSTWASSRAPGNPHWRNEECDADDIAHHAESLGLFAYQEKLEWGYPYKTDCFTTLKWT